MVKKLYPFESHYLSLKGLKYHYLDEGKGDPVVMLHGNPTWSFYYRNLVLSLRGNYRTIVPDHIGCGLSDKPGAEKYDYHFEQRARDLEALLDHLEIQKNITLVLHDWGGMIGMVYAHLHPERIKRLVIFNTAAFHLPSRKFFPWPLWICRNTALGAHLILRYNAFSAIASRVCCIRKILRPEVRSAYIAPYNSAFNRIATLKFVQDIPLLPQDRGYGLISEVEKNLPQFASLPALICWGMQDFVFDHHFLKIWETYLPHATVHKFRSSGHYVLEDSTEEIVPLVKEFLMRNPI